MKTIGIVCCSNGQREEWRPQNEALAAVLAEMDCRAVFSPCIYAVDGVASGSGQERAAALMKFYLDDTIDMICDISGGDIANEVLDFLDYEAIARHPKPLFGYSDLTTVLNAVYTKTGVQNVLYQLKNLVYSRGEMQRRVFAEYLRGGEELFRFPVDFLQGERMEGTLVGGNVRCLLKLAGTPYFPDMHGKILLLEALGGEREQLITYFSQLRQMGVFELVSGVLLGTFTKMEEKQLRPTAGELLLRYVPASLPVAKTALIGHGADSRGAVIGGQVCFTK